MTVRTRRPVEIESPWLVVSEAASYSRNDTAVIYGALASGELVGHRRGKRGQWRIHREDLDAWIRGLRAAAS